MSFYELTMLFGEDNTLILSETRYPAMFAPTIPWVNEIKNIFFSSINLVFTHAHVFILFLFI